MKTGISMVCIFVALTGIANAQEGNFHLDKEYKMSPTGLLSLNVSDAKVYITGSTRATVHIKIDREVTTKGLSFGHEDFSVEVSEESGNLTIRERSNSVSVGMVGYRYEKYTITIEAPEGSSLRVKGDDGGYWIKNIDGAVSLELDDADVELAGCSGDKFNFRMDDGDISMDEGKGTLDLDADDGDVTIKNAAFQTIDASMDDGDLDIETSLNDAGNYRIDVQDGSLALTITYGGGQFDIRHDDGHISTLGDFSVTEDSENHTRLTLNSGSAQVNIRTDDARVKLAKR